jgi:hypothetical protein
MATSASNPTYTPPAKTEGPFGTQGQQPGTGLNAPREGEVAKRIERTTSQVPSDTFLWAALGAVGASLLLRTARQKNASLFIGQWVSPLLLFGVYNKLVKLGGSDKFSR